MVSGPITLWEKIDGETVATVADFILGGSKITADGDCSHEIKRRLLSGRKAMTKLDSILKSRDIALPTKVCLVKAMVFPVVTYGYESWTVTVLCMDSDCSQKIKRRLLLGRKAMTNLDSILKSRDLTLLKTVHIVEAMVFPVVMYDCER